MTNEGIGYQANNSIQENISLLKNFNEIKKDIEQFKQDVRDIKTNQIGIIEMIKEVMPKEFNRTTLYIILGMLGFCTFVGIVHICDIISHYNFYRV